MGVMDFIQDAGAAVGVGKSTKEESAEKAKAKAAADLAAARKAEAAEKAAAAKAAKARSSARAKVAAAKKKQAEVAEREATMEAEKAAKLTKYVSGLGLKARGMNIGFNDGVATVTGTASNRATKEKIVLALGNVAGVRQVNDKMKVAPATKAAAATSGVTAAQRRAATQRRREAAAAQTMHTVKSGDTLSKLAKKYLGDASRYPEIFKANQPMLTNPDMINVGQVLRIPRK